MSPIEQIWDALKDVMDPEIPTISLVDLGVITGVEVTGDNVVRVTMTPTFTGCPAMEYMRNDVRRRLESMGFAGVEVEMNFDEAWSSNKVSDVGRQRLKEFGLAPPEKYDLVLDLEVLNNTACPFCGSHDTMLQSPFGPTLCRSIHYCRNCAQAFEGFKPM